MPFYSSTDQLYTCAGALFSRIEKENPGAGNALRSARLVIRLRCTLPDGEFTLNGRRPLADASFRPVQTILGPAEFRPEVDITLSSDTLHRILLGELSLGKALATGLLQVKGPVLKTLALADLFHAGQKWYPEILHEQGLMTIHSAS
jgi:hypothetical protein